MNTKILKRALLLFAGALSSSTSWAKDLIEVKSPVPYPINNFWIYLFFGCAVVLLFLFLRNLYKDFVKKGPRLSQQSPAEIAYTQLDQLRAQHLPEKGELKKY